MKTLKTYTIAATLLLITSFLSAGQAFGFEVDQTIIQMSPQGLNSKKIIKLNNKEKYKKIVSIETFERSFGTKENEPKITTLLKVNEKNVVLPPESETPVAIEWAGTDPLRQEKAFRVIITELKKDKSDVNHLNDPLLQYVTSVFVTPEGAEEKIEVRKSELKRNNLLNITVRNTGKKHKIFLDDQLVIQDSKTKETLAVVQDSEVLQQTLLMPGQTKVIELPLNQNLKKKPFTVSFVKNEGK